MTESTLRQLINEIADATPELLPESVIYCDMDGVLVDFETEVVGMVNRLLDGEHLEGSEVSKSYGRKLRKLQRELGPDWRAQARPDLDIKLVRDFMMTAISINPGPVFARMPPHKDGVGSLWPYLNSTGHTVNILSAPIGARDGASMTTEEGKKLWILENLEPQPSNIIITPARSKVEYAISGDVANIIIDDKASTVKAWNDAGGIGILHTPGGSASTIRQLRDLGI